MAAVSDRVDARGFLPQVEILVGVEVAAGVKGAELEDSCGASRPQSGACNAHSVLDQPPARTFGPAGGEGGVLTQERCLGKQAADHNWPVWTRKAPMADAVHMHAD